MAPTTANQRAWQERFQTAIRVMAPGLDLLLAAGDRLSRVLGSDDDWEPPVRPRDSRARVGSRGERPRG